MKRCQFATRLLCVVTDEESLAFCEQQKQEWEHLHQEWEHLKQEWKQRKQEWKQRKQEWKQLKQGQKQEWKQQQKQQWKQQKQEWKQRKRELKQRKRELINRKQVWIQRKNVEKRDQYYKGHPQAHSHTQEHHQAHLLRHQAHFQGGLIELTTPASNMLAAQKSVPLQPQSEPLPAQLTNQNVPLSPPSTSVLVNSNERVLLFVSTTRSIVLLADLMVTATSKDFKLIASEPLALVKYSNSFQATVVQTANKGYDAFNEAQKSMAQLVQLAERGASLATESLNVIEEGEPADIQDFLPITLKEIIDVVGKCAVMTSAVVGKYDDLVQLIREILRCNIPSIDVHRLLKDTSAEIYVVQNQWEYLASFFANIVDIITGSLHKTIQEFIQIVEQENADRDATGIEDSAEFEESGELGTTIAKNQSEIVKKEKNLLTEDIKQISEVANKIRETAVIYSEISQQYLLKCILSLNSLAAMNPTKDSAAIEGLRREIRQDCLKADQAIAERKL